VIYIPLYVCEYIHIYTYTHNGVLVSIRKNETIWFEGKLMPLEDIMLSEASQAQKGNGHMFYLICGR
jgi:hypothetical protein